MERGNAVVAALVLCHACAVAQVSERPERPEGPPPEQQFLFYEAVNLTGADPGLARVDVHYRVDLGFFVPVRNPDTSLAFPFRRRGEITVELVDSTGRSQARTIQRFTRGASNEDREFSLKHWYQALASFHVPAGRYSLYIEVDDLESQRRYTDRSQTINTLVPSSTALTASTAMFVVLDDSTDDGRLIPQNYGGQMLFGRRGGLYFELTPADTEDVPIRLEYEFVVAARFARDRSLVLSDTIPLTIPLRSAGLTIDRGEDSLLYSIATGSPTRCLSVVLPLALEQLQLRNYDLTIRVFRGTERTEIRKSFSAVWPDMPLSLRDVTYALESLRPIVSERVLDSLMRGTQEERIKNLEAFWQEKDQTPGTAYNEIMMEYYRRVDYARRTFGSLREPDGSKADRGRIFIIFGPPSRTDRTLDPTLGYQEVWTYENLDRKFVFVDKTRSGNYVLLSNSTP